MLQTYQGYFQEGRFVSPEAAAIPDNASVIITVLGNGLPPLGTVSRSQQQLEAFERFLAAVRESDDKPLTDEDFAELEKNRVNFKRELDL